MDTKTTVIDPGQLDAQFGYCDQIAAWYSAAIRSSRKPRVQML